MIFKSVESPRKSMELIANYIQTVDSAAVALFSIIICAVFVIGFWLATKLKSSKTFPSTERLKSEENVNDTMEVHSPEKNCLRNNSSSGGKQSRLRRINNRKGLKNKNTVPLAKGGQDHLCLTDSAVETWLQSDVYCYKKTFAASSTEDNLISCSVMEQDDKSPTAAAGIDENLNSSSSSNENLSLTCLDKANPSDKEIVIRPKRKQKRKNRTKCLNNEAYLLKTDAEEEVKENAKPSGVTVTSAKTVLSLRKQCTKAAALKATLNSNKIPRTSIPEYNSLESFVSVKSSLSYSSSSITSNTCSTSSSTSSSPTQSVNSSPTASPTTKRYTEYPKRRLLVPPLRQYTKLDMKEYELVQQMKRYIIDPRLLRIYGFPVESVHTEGCVDIYKCLPKHLAEEAVTQDNQRHHCHFYGRRKCDIVNESDGLYASCSGPLSSADSLTDSGNVSGESSPLPTDSDSSEMGEEDTTSPLMEFYTPDGVYQIFSDYCSSTEKQCVRCFKTFEVNESGEYLSFDACTYHWGKLNNVYNGKCYVNIYSCCQSEEHSEGCSQHHLHVWNGVEVGLNGPYKGFSYTQSSNKQKRKQTKLYALDCEMSYTGLGLEVTKVTVVGFDGSMVYEHFVKPQAEIVDYNTRFSGVSEKDFLHGSNTSTKTFAEVQKDLLNLFDSETILVGHGLDNDLKALRLVHKTIVDTSVIFSHSTGYPYKRSLKNLTKSFLKRDIQCGDMGHSSFEDSRACLELMMWKIRKDLRHWSYN